MGAHRRDRNTSHSSGIGEGPRHDAARAGRHDLSVAVAGERAAQFEQNYRARASFLGWLAKFLGRLHAFVKLTGWSDVTSTAQRQRRTLPRKLVVFQREPQRKRATHAKFSRTHKLAKTGKFWFCWRCGFYTAQRAKGLAERCRGIVQCPSGVLRKLKDGRNPKDGRWLTCGGPGGRGTGGYDGCWMGLV